MNFSKLKSTSPVHALIALALLASTVGAFAAALPQPAAGWRLELIAEAPRIKHPSVVCTAPDGRVFVAEDPMDITAPADATLGRILCLHPDGRLTVFAEKLHAVFGMQYLEGRLYVLHNPKFTMFTDDAGVGTDRVDLIEQTNPNPWALDWNDHVPANFRLAMDGYFYVAVGDKGLYQCRGRDGSEVNLHGGGILRLRPDATQLEVFSTGTRNILDVSLNAEDEPFTYDNTDEHQWMGRLTHMVDGGFYGYPHDFIPQRPYTLWMMHDFGAGAACGTLANNEDALPPEYRGNLFLADFGKRQVTRVRVERAGGSFRVAAQEELFRDQPEDFRPVGIAFAPDGLSLYICDWQHRDVKEKDASTGRLWKLTWTGSTHAAPKPAWYLPLALGHSTVVSNKELVAALSHPSHAVRLTAQRALARGKNPPKRQLAALLADSSASAPARWHALWTLDSIDAGQSVRKEILAATGDKDASVARQAIRQVGQRHWQSAMPALVSRLKHDDASIRFHTATALGRIAETNSIAALTGALADTDLFARHAAFTALNRIGRAHADAWPAIVAGLGSPNQRIRETAGFALRETFSAPLVDALGRMASDRTRSVETRESAMKSLAALHHQPPEWRGEWWAYHPAKAPPPERTVSWTRTETILATLRAALSEPDARLRLAAVEGLSEARDTNSAAGLRARFKEDSDLAVRRAALQALARLKDTDSARLVAELLRSPQANPALLADAVHLSAQFGGAEVTKALVDRLQNGSPPAELRLPCIDALARIGGDASSSELRSLIKSPAIGERRAAIRASGQLRDKAAVMDLLESWKLPDARADALAALCRIGDLLAVDAYLEGLDSVDPAVREQCRKALTPFRTEALPMIEKRTTPTSATALAELRKVYAGDAEALKKPLFTAGAKSLEPVEYERHALAQHGDAANGAKVFFNEQGVACVRCHAVGGKGGAVGPDLTLAGTQFSRAQLIESILYPSRSVREGYQQIVVETKDGDETSGALKADTADGLTLVDATGQTRFVPRASIVNRRTSNLSLMPEGLQVGLTLDEFADLVAFLESRKTDPPRAPR